ncbi:MAG TPA: hypothetical protein VEU32_02020 [Burkholderiales bacterium]|nr:hypothetical protein [Burkholderiales bacterium]
MKLAALVPEDKNLQRHAAGILAVSMSHGNALEREIIRQLLDK